MKKLSLFLIFTLSISCFADSQIHIFSNKDHTGAITSYTVRTWNGIDGAMIDTQYTVQDAVQKFGKLLDPNEVGTSSSPDRITLLYDNDGNLTRVISQNTSIKTYSIVDGEQKDPQVTGEIQVVEKSNDELSNAAKTDIANTKEDIETKTGKEIDGNVKPK